MAQENPLANIISTKVIEKIASGAITEQEAQDLNSKLLSNYLNISKDTADRLKRSTNIYNFWRDTLQNVHNKSDINNFEKSLTTIIQAVPTSMLGQFTMLYNKSAEPKQASNTHLNFEQRLKKNDNVIQSLLPSMEVKNALKSIKNKLDTQTKIRTPKKLKEKIVSTNSII